MKSLILSLVAILYTCLCLAQTPQALNYQAVARTSTGQIIPSQNVGVRFSILDGSVTGTLIYQETQTTTTNNFGLFTLAIGKGTSVTGTFSAIAWETGNKFLKVEIAPQGGTNYLLQGTTQLLSVPYALYSEKTKLLAGNNTISISNGNTITGNYQAANNTVLVNGNTIAGNYQAANNTVAITGNTIAGNYQPANNTVSISGNTIAANYQAGSGISITGNTITSTASSLWVPDADGIHNQTGHVGIGTNSFSLVPLVVQQENSGVGNAVLHLKSNDVWHTAMTMFSHPTTNSFFSFIIGGPLNTDVMPGNFAIYNHSAIATFPYTLQATMTTNFVGIGSASPSTPPRSRLHVFNGDINIEQIGSGIIMKSPNGQCWRITIDNTGNLVRTAITCP